jgi:biotin carboxylase
MYYVFLNSYNNPFGVDSINYYEEYLNHIKKEYRVLFTCQEFVTPDLKNILEQHFNQIIYLENAKAYYQSAELEKKIIVFAQNHSITAIVPNAIDEYDIKRCADLRDYLNINSGLRLSDTIVFRDKYAMKEIIKNEGLSLPHYALVKCGLDLIRFIDTHGFPVVIKPNSGFGMVNTTVIQNNADLDLYLSHNFSADYLSDFIVETFVKGKVHHIDGFVYDDEIVIWPSIYENSCLEMALDRKILISHPLQENCPLTERLISYGRKVVKLFSNQKRHSFHLEAYVTPDEHIVFCEIAARVGGGVNRLWKNNFNIDLESIFYKIQTGQHLENIPEIKRKCYAGMYMIPAQLNKKIVKIPNKCDFDPCEFYITFLKDGDLTSSGEDVFSNLALAYITGSSFEEYQKNSDMFLNWFYTELQYS